MKESPDIGVIEEEGLTLIKGAGGVRPVHCFVHCLDVWRCGNPRNVKGEVLDIRQNASFCLMFIMSVNSQRWARGWVL
jgi:hypothetical protein